MTTFPRAVTSPLNLAVVLTFALLSHAQAQLVQQGPKLVGTGAAVNASQGYSVAVSADGNTALVGGPSDNGALGAAWVYTRTAGVWSQQGSKLVGTGAVGNAQQGTSVALSADGNTALIGGFFDDSGVGAAWVFTRSAGVWTQQGSKLVGTGAAGPSLQGWSVALSADGETAIVGGYTDNSSAGAAWVFTRNAGVWSQQGPKLVGTGATGNAQQGFSVALSADGNTAIVGGHKDNSSTGATWIFTRNSGSWTQEGSKLVGTGATGAAGQGFSVSLSADGNTAVVGGPSDDSAVGATWVFTRTAGLWTQQGSKLVGTGASGAAQQGFSVSLSADGNTALWGGPGDNSQAGAAWIFTRSAGSWTQQGSKLVGAGAIGAARQGGSVALSADGYTAIVGGPEDNIRIGAAWVFVTPPAMVTTHPQPQTVCEGMTANFTAAASGSPTPTVQWQVSTNGGMSFTDIPGATNTTLSFTATAGMNGNLYQAVFTNTGGTDTSDPALLTVNTAPTVTLDPVSQTVPAGQVATFMAAATGTAPIAVQWQVSTNGGATFTNIPGETSTTLTFTATLADVDNLYRAVFTNGCGYATTRAAGLRGIDGVYLIRYSSNLTQGDSLLNITNTGVNGASLFGPGYGGAAGNICVNVYAFSPDEQLVSCCSCLVTPNGLMNMSANRDLVSNTLTGISPSSIVIKLVSTGAGRNFEGSTCANSAALAGTAAFPLASGMLAWGTTLHSSTTIDPAPIGTPFSITETPFLPSTLRSDELASITSRCANIIGNGSTFGQCRSCRLGGLGGAKQ